MKLVPESFYVNGKHICTRQAIWHNEGTALIEHAAYFCRHCGDIWARRIYAVSDIEHRIIHRECERHGNGSLIWGDVEEDHITDPYYERYYPLEWLAYELFLIVRRYP